MISLSTSKFKIGLSVLALGAAVLATADRTIYTSHYHINSPDFEVTNIIANESAPEWGGSSWAYYAGAGDTTNIDLSFGNLFNFISTPPQTSILIGLAHDLPNDAPGQQHVVLMMDNTAASLAQNIAWGTLFRNTDEDQLIAAIQLYTSGQPFPVIQPGIDFTNQFLGGDAQTGILDNLAQSHSAWFNTGDSFSVVAWSSGQVIGTGTSDITSEVVPTPEPASMAMLGIGAVALIRRRFKK